VLPLDYGFNFGIFWLVLAALTAAVSVWAFMRERRVPRAPLQDDTGR